MEFAAFHVLGNMCQTLKLWNFILSVKVEGTTRYILIFKGKQIWNFHIVKGPSYLKHCVFIL